MLQILMPKFILKLDTFFHIFHQWGNLISYFSTDVTLVSMHPWPHKYDRSCCTTLKGQFIKIMRKSISHLPLMVFNHADSFGLINPSSEIDRSASIPIQQRSMGFLQVSLFVFFSSNRTLNDSTKTICKDRYHKGSGTQSAGLDPTRSRKLITKVGITQICFTKLCLTFRNKNCTTYTLVSKHVFV